METRRGWDMMFTFYVLRVANWLKLAYEIWIFMNKWTKYVSIE